MIEPYYSIIIVFLALILMYYVGFGFSKFILPKEFYNNEILAIPFIGLAILTTITYNFAYIGLNSKTSLLIFFVISSILNFIAIKKRKLMELNIPENIIPIIISFIVLLVSLVPLINIGYLTVIGANGDAMTHALVSEYLEGNGLKAPAVSSADLYVINHRLTSFYPIGFQFFQSFIDIISGTKAYMNFSLLTALFLALNVLSTYIFARYMELDRKTASLAVCFMAFNSVLFWGHYDDFGPQMLGVSLMPLAVCSGFNALKNPSKHSFIFGSLFLAAVFSVYQEAAYLVVIPLIVYSVLSFFIQKKNKNIAALFIIIILSVLLNMIKGISLAVNFFNRVIGELNLFVSKIYGDSFGSVNPVIAIDEGPKWNIWYNIPIERIYGLLPFKTDYISDYGLLASPGMVFVVLFMLLSIICISLYGLYRAKNRKELSAILIPSVLIYYALASTYNTYYYFKVLTLTMFILFIVLAEGVNQIYGRSASPIVRIQARSFCIIFIILFMMLNLYSIDVLTDSLKQNGIVINKDYIDATELLSISDPKSQILVMSRGYEPYNQWAPYFLKGRNIRQVMRNADASPYNIDNFDDVDYILYRSNNYSRLSSNNFDDVWRNTNLSIYVRNTTVLGHFPAETLKPVSSIYYHNFKFLESGDTVFYLNKNNSLNISISASLFRVNQNVYSITRNVTNKSSLGVQFYVFENTTVNITYDDRVYSIDLGSGVTLYTMNITKVPVNITIENNNISNVSVDWFELYNNTRLTTHQEKVVLASVATNLMNSNRIINESDNLKALKIISARDGNYLNVNLSVNYSYNSTLALDIYRIEETRHPDYHYGFWGVDIDNETQNVSIHLDMINKTAIIFKNNKTVGINSWVGNISSGEFIARIVLWNNKMPEYAEEVSHFKILDGGVINFAGKSNVDLYKTDMDIRIYSPMKNLSLRLEMNALDAYMASNFGYFGTYSKGAVQNYKNYGTYGFRLKKSNKTQYVTIYIDSINKSAGITSNNYVRPSVYTGTATEGRFLATLVIWDDDENKPIDSFEAAYLMVDNAGSIKSIKYNNNYDFMSVIRN